MTDGFAYLADAGWPLERLQWYMKNGVDVGELADSVQGLVESGRYTMEQLIAADASGDDDPPPDVAPPMLSTVSAVELQRKDLPPIRWIVQDLVAAGLTILASPPKFGKSWMAMHLCLSVAMGGSFLGYQCHKTGCLYMALEDGERRLKSRMQKILHPVPAPQGFDFTTMAPTLGTGLIDALEGYIKLHPETGLFVLDTLQKIRDVGGGRDVYGRDYADVGTLKKFADAHNIAVLIIHHLRKMGDDSDPFARISGSNGISGAADTMMVLAKERRSEETATLSITGRDVEMQELVLQFDKSSCLWMNLGDADAFAEQQARREYADSPIVQTIRKLLEQSPDGWTGTAGDLLTAGRFIARTTLADSTQSLTNKLKEMDKLLLEYDGISHERKRNGSGGGKHIFRYVNAPQFEELPQTEIDPFSEG